MLCPSYLYKYAYPQSYSASISSSPSLNKDLFCFCFSFVFLVEIGTGISGKTFLTCLSCRKIDQISSSCSVFFLKNKLKGFLDEMLSD